MFRENVSLADFASYKIGGPARYFFEANNVADIRRALEKAKKEDLAVFVLGGGTNLLIGEEGFKGLVLKPNLGTMDVLDKEISVGAGVSMSDLLDFSAGRGLSGLEWAGGLPGTFGGAVRGNAGAFGGEMKDVVKSVRSLDTKTLREIERNTSESDFGYRSSIFKKMNGNEIILSAVISLKEGDREAVRRAMDEKIAYRRARHPLEYPNIGSTFKNVALEKAPAEARKSLAEVVKNDPFPVIPAAYLISETGLKGVSLGGAMISPKHPNFIVNILQASSSDVDSLIELAKKEVLRKFGISLEEEIIRV